MSAIEKAAMLLARDLDAEGWDQPARLYLVMGELDDPSLVLMGVQAQGHPYDLLSALPPIPREDVAQGVIGLALAMESWIVHPSKETREEVMRQAQQVWDEGKALYGEPCDLTLEAWFERAWEHYRNGVAPSQHPDRRECRLVHVRTLDARTILVMRYRDGEEVIMRPDDEDDAYLMGRMQEQLERLTHELEGGK